MHYRYGLIFLLFTLTCTLLFSLEVPFSIDPVNSETNTLTGFLRIEPEDLAIDPLNTISWIWQDSDDLVVQIRCDMENDFTFGNFSPRDYGSEADFLRIQLVTIPNAFFSYIYVAYPNGSLKDGVRDPDLNQDFSWDSSYTYSTEITTEYWQVTFRIPLGELRFKQEIPYRWKIILTRYHHKSKQYFSHPALFTDEGKEYFNRAIDINLQHKIKRSFQFKLMPYYVRSYDLLNKTVSYDPDNVGLDLSFSPTSKTKAKISLNPDFSNVPMDAAMDYYNTKKPIYLSEQRYFFTEDIDAFGVNREFYTRNIVQPQFSYKLTGNTHGVYFGVLGAKDKKIIEGDNIINSDDYFQVLAIRPELKRFSINNAIISRINKGYYHHQYSGKLSWEILRGLFAKALFVSSIRKAENESDNTSRGLGGSAELKYNPKEWEARVYYSGLSKNYTNDSGYDSANDYRKLGVSFAYAKTPKERNLKTWNSSFSYELWLYNQSSNPYKDYTCSYDINLDFLRNYSIGSQFVYSEEHTSVQTKHKIFRANINFSKQFGDLYLFLFSSYNKNIVYALDKTYPAIINSISMSYNLSDKTGLGLSFMHTDYSYSKYNTICYENTSYLISLDNKYQIVNASFRYNPSIRASLRMGLGISTYETEMAYLDLNYYCNASYEVKPDWFLYVGYKTSQFQDGKLTNSDLLGKFVKYENSAYMKLSVII